MEQGRVTVYVGNYFEACLYGCPELPSKTTPTATVTKTATPTRTPTSTATATPTNTSAVSTTPTATSDSFPLTGILDNFNRSNGGIGSGWSGSTSGYSISGNKLDVGSGGDIYWNANAFGASQEVYIKFSTVASSGEEQDLILKSQCSGWPGDVVLEVCGQISSSNFYF